MGFRRATAVWLLAAEGVEGHVPVNRWHRRITVVTKLVDRERAPRRVRPRRWNWPATPTSCARGSGKTIIAGYPWFTDWGRDTFIALRGLCLATGRLDDARAILLEWAGLVSEGMLPNRFVEGGDERRSSIRSTPRSGM